MTVREFENVAIYKVLNIYDTNGKFLESSEFCPLSPKYLDNEIKFIESPKKGYFNVRLGMIKIG